MQILNIHPDIESTYYNAKFLDMIESHLTHLRRTEGIQALSVTEHQGYKYEGDLFGLLDDLMVEKKYHHIVMRVNDIQSSADYKGNLPHILLPSLNEIDMIKNIFQSSESDVE